MSSTTPAYRKLSSWRSFFVGGAVFRDEHCLVSVRSSGFEERVKRIYFKDIQAIVVSKSRRFGVSRRVMFGVLLLLVALSFASRFSLLPAIVRLAVGIALVLAWLYISIRESCRCRVYTAVSQEELPSVRRPWTVRKLLAELTPLIEAAQGTLPPGWQESVAIGRAIPLGQAADNSTHEAAPGERAEWGAGRFTPSAVLVASLLLDILQTSWDLQRAQPMPAWIGSTLALIEAAAAVWVLVHNRGIDVSLQRLGAAVLIFLGLAFYGQAGIVFYSQVQAQVRTKRPLQSVEIRSSPADREFREVYIAGCLVLAVIGAFLTLASPTPQRPRVPAD
jgi:hypothetical protein